MPRSLRLALGVVLLLGLSGCISDLVDVPPPLPPARDSSHAGGPLVDRLPDEPAIVALGWEALGTLPDAIGRPELPAPPRCDGDLAPLLADGVRRISASTMYRGAEEFAGDTRTASLELLVLSDVDDATFDRVTGALLACDGERASTSDDPWDVESTTVRILTRSLVAGSFGYERITSDFSTSRTETVVLVPGADDTMLVVAVTSRRSTDVYPVAVLERAVEAFSPR